MRVVEGQQYSPEWWDLRRGVPTGSAFKFIITPGGKLSASWRKYACLLIAETFDAYYSGDRDDYQSASMESGSLLEPKAKAWYEFHRDATVREVGFCFADGDRCYGCSPDGLVGDDGVLESKSPMAKTHIEYLLGGELPDAYKPQCHGHLVVTGREWCDFLSFVPGFPAFIIRVTPDEYTANLKSAVEEFCDKYAAMLAEVKSQWQSHIDSEIDRLAEPTPVAHRSFVA